MAVLVKLSITGNFWPRDDLASGSLGDARSILDFSVQLPQVVIAERSLYEFARDLTDWLDTPSHVEADLSFDKSQSLSVSLGIRDELLSKIDRPACTIAYSSERMLRGEWVFIVDQSCIQLFRNDLDELLSKLQDEHSTFRSLQ
jgi:hypothetical protein